MDQDKRFTHISNDPRFKRIPKAAQKLKIGKRFQSMFKDDKFQVKYTTDKRGRPIKYSTNDDLKKYYELTSSSDEEDSEENDAENIESENEENIECEKPGQFVRESKNDEETDPKKENTEHDEVITDEMRKKLRNPNVDYARGEGQLLSESSSSDDEGTESEISEDEGVEHDWGELDKDAETTDDLTHRLAACNMDWDRIRAVDLMVLFNSFLPAGGLIKSIHIYPSEFGKKRMQEEDVKGPIELCTNDNEEDTNNETEDGAKFRMEKLRQYQLNRLKYYYAIIEFDSAATANKVYTECDGMEYESSATKLDLRFVPDSETFNESPKESCTKLPGAGKYQPRYFTTTALQQANVELTWDETNPERSEIAKKLASGEELNDVDLHNYLASSSGEEDEEEIVDEDNEQDDKQKINKYKALLQEIENKDKVKDNDVEMEISWGMNLKEKTDQLIKEKRKNKNLTPFEEFLQKKKDKKKLKKAAAKQDNESDDDDDDIDMNDPYFTEELKNMPKKSSKKPVKESSVEPESNAGELELLLMNENDDGKKHFSLKKIQDQEKVTKKKKKYKKAKDVKEVKEDDFEINVNDDRFAALYNSHHYNIDPADPHFKKTKAMESLIEEKFKRRKIEDTVQLEENKVNKNTELNVLVKSIKRKSNVFNKNKKKS